MYTPEEEMVVMRLLAWRRAEDGTWWAHCGLRLWSVAVGEGGRTRAVPRVVTSWVPADRLQPIPEEDYAEVPRITGGRSAAAQQPRRPTLEERTRRSR
ncbi:hypothetical protein DVA86_32360 [Streptomyces armeniacus]|uniref:Uncharacterized protein n=1 Tax=Streptomyces armeniacus TaxID=83291 RepID=A0A345XY57_9ACTN|nr:hypothetical protein DVA86_32360 [Streptomyces armeniacus]